MGRTPLHIAAALGNLETVKLLIKYGAEINYQDTCGWTPFNLAVVGKHRKVINYLIANGAKIETNDTKKILLSIHPYNSLEAVPTMMELEIWNDVVKKFIGAHLLRYAARCGVNLMVHTLLEKGVNANESDDLGLTALHEAAKYNHTEVVSTLILYGANVNVQSESGECPLSYAVERRHWRVVMTLLYHGANPSLPDQCGETVRALAKRQGISNLLVEEQNKEP